MEITFPFRTSIWESQESQRQQIKSKMKYANVIIFIRECLWQKAINFSSASWHFNICITCFSQMIIFVFSISVDRALFSFPLHLVIFLNFPCLKRCNGLWLKFHSEKLSEIHVVCLMEKIIARQMKQSMTHSNQEEWLQTQVSREVSLLTLSLAAVTYCTHSFTQSFPHSLTRLICCSLTRSFETSFTHVGSRIWQPPIILTIKWYEILMSLNQKKMWEVDFFFAQQMK